MESRAGLKMIAGGEGKMLKEGSMVSPKQWEMILSVPGAVVSLWMGGLIKGKGCGMTPEDMPCKQAGCAMHCMVCVEFDGKEGPCTKDLLGDNCRECAAKLMHPETMMSCEGCLDCLIETWTNPEDLKKASPCET